MKLGCRSLPGGGMSTAARVRAIMDHRATVVCCTPTYALHLAEVAASEGIDLSASPVKTLIVAGEPGGSIPVTRARLESSRTGDDPPLDLQGTPFRLLPTAIRAGYGSSLRRALLSPKSLPNIYGMVPV